MSSTIGTVAVVADLIFGWIFVVVFVDVIFVISILANIPAVDVSVFFFLIVVDVFIITSVAWPYSPLC